MTRRVLLFGTDIVPLTREMPATGAGLRTWQFYNGLREAGFDVRLSLYEGVVNKYADVLPDDVRRLAWSCSEESQLKIIDEVQPDALVVCHWPTWYVRRRLPIPMAIDFHGPHLLERHYQQFGRARDNIEEKLRVLRLADVFICAGDYQRDYFAGWLMQIGVMPDRQTLISIPISQSPELPPRKQGPRRPVRFVYSGVFLPWQDPFDALLAACDVLGQRDDGVLEFFGGPHPVHKIDTRRFDEFQRRVEAVPQVAFRGFVNRKTLLAAYEQADVALDLMKHNSERELAFTTRTVEYLWCGLPVIYNNYSELSEYIADYEAGWTVDPLDPEQLRHVLREILDHPKTLDRYAANAQRLVREQFSWEKTVAPLAEFCRHPRHAARMFDEQGQEIDLENADATIVLPEFIDQRPVVQSFRARRENLCSISYCVACYARVNSHRLRVELVDDLTEDVIAVQELDAAKLIDNSWVNFEFPAQPQSAGRLYRLRFKSEAATPGNAITLWSTSKRRYPFGELRQGNQPAPATLCLIGRCQAA